jgi:predicted nucleic acid-binding Zn ribbon protein
MVSNFYGGRDSIWWESKKTTKRDRQRAKRLMRSLVYLLLLLFTRVSLPRQATKRSAKHKAFDEREWYFVCGDEGINQLSKEERRKKADVKNPNMKLYTIAVLLSKYDTLNSIHENPK